MKSLRLLVCGNRTLFLRLMPLTLLLSFPLMGVHEVKTKEELSQALKSSKKAAVKVGADWCGACKMSEKPFHNATAKHPDVKALSINADNKEFRKFIRMFQVEGLPTTVYLRKVEPSDPDYSEVADLVGVEGNATIVLSRKDVGSRNEEEFSKSIGALSPAAPKAKEEPKKQPVAVAEEAPEPRQVKKGRARFEREERAGRKKTRRSRRRETIDRDDFDEMAKLGFPVENTDII